MTPNQHSSRETVKNARACRRSPETRTCVTVMRPAPRTRGFTDAADYRRLFPDGRIVSDPSRASPEHGAQLIAVAVRDIAEDYRNFVTRE